MSYNGYLCSSHNLVICHSTFLIWHNLYALLKMKIITKTLKESYEEEATIMEKILAKYLSTFSHFSTISVHHKWKRNRILSPKVNIQVAERLKLGS